MLTLALFASPVHISVTFVEIWMMDLHEEVCNDSLRRKNEGVDVDVLEAIERCAPFRFPDRTSPQF